MSGSSVPALLKQVMELEKALAEKKEIRRALIAREKEMEPISSKIRKLFFSNMEELSDGECKEMYNELLAIREMINSEMAARAAAAEAPPPPPPEPSSGEQDSSSAKGITGSGSGTGSGGATAQ